MLARGLLILSQRNRIHNGLLGKENKTVSERTIGRLSQYRRLLKTFRDSGVLSLYSHELARKAGVSAAQVRRDLMEVGYHGSPHNGYVVDDLLESISSYLDDPDGLSLALIGVGNLGGAILSHYAEHRSSLSVVAAFDSDPEKTNRVIHGCRCHPLEELTKVVREQNIRVGIIAVPSHYAQDTANKFIEAGVYSLVNFAPVTLHIPDYVRLETVDITMFLDRAAFFAPKQAKQAEPVSTGR